LAKGSKKREVVEAELQDYLNIQTRIKALMPKVEATKQAKTQTIPTSEQKVQELEIQVRGLRKQIENVSRAPSITLLFIESV
jgi:archaellum component FlaC